MAIYAILGFAQAFGLFSMGAVFALFTFNASRTLHRNALTRIMHAPVSFFDTTPLGRIMNRFSKDIDTLDNIVGEAMRQFLGTMVQVIGSIILVSIIIPWFLIAVAFVLVLYYWITIFYRASARELKRLDAVLRSSLYGHFSESMTGLSTIRAYGEAPRFKNENASRTNLENRAYWLSVSNQRWLSVRLDFLGSIMVFAVAIMAIGIRADVSPAQTGVALSYMLVVQQAFGWAVRQSAEVENNMSAVERILHYTSEVEQEALHDIPDNKPPPSWPSIGSIEMKDVVVSYRPELPPVLRGVSLDIRGGEHIGIVGRTGAGKSTITMTLYRTIELLSGYIKVDGIDISEIGLRDLRSALAIIPQEPLLFSGDLRSNLDPFGQYDDARLWDALKRSWLVENVKSDGYSSSASSTINEGSSNRLTLDTRIEEGGSNLSVGQRSLVSLARALVKNSKIILMDEATASVDFETDRNIQDTIQVEFADRTLLCIAHRLRTIIGYDRICVLDAGQVKEFDSPENLWMKEGGVFRGMCERSGISLVDIKMASEQNRIMKRMLNLN
ncbi:abc transporter [Moniliophthora roreri MCA 2997]|uniref:Abc transporter n=1 Tax=Moniliophthora roreri (strain MCA 2997) TaxID=1381753 RepID=V2X7J6_MONRO|nr:abc transporter [Moniliophthora roreri MCA 2997]